MTRWLWGVLLTVTVLSAAWGKPRPMDLVDVPVDRMIASLNKKLAAHPKDAHVEYLLGRVNAIAYAQKTSTLRVDRMTEEEAPWDGPALPPSQVKRATDAAQKKVAAARLEQALVHYRRAMQLDRNDFAARLGYGWCLVEAGRRKEAVTVLSSLFDAALAKESLNKRWMPFEPCYACEAGRYLVPLLDPVKDADRIAAVRAASQRLEALPRAVTPIVIPLEDVGFEACVDRTARVRFDLDASGEPRTWQWITPRAGWLVYVGNGERSPSDGTRLVGARTFWVFWKNGYEALETFDDDGDGMVAGAELDGLGVWNDADGDGVVDRGEVMRLVDVGVVGLSCRFERHAEGFPYSPGGVLLSNGRVRDSWDWIVQGRR